MGKETARQVRAIFSVDEDEGVDIRRFVLAVCTSATMLSGCGGGGVSPSVRSSASLHSRKPPSGSTPITHIVLVIQENRTFNNLFAGFPGATTSKTGFELRARVVNTLRDGSR